MINNLILHIKISVLYIKISVLYIKISVLYIKISVLHIKISVLYIKISASRLCIKISVLYIKICASRLVFCTKVSVLYIKICVLHIKICVLYIKISASRLVFSTLKLVFSTSISVLHIKISVLYIKISASRLVFSTLKLVFSTSISVLHIKISVLYIKISASRLVFSTLKLVFSTSISVLHIKISVLYIKITVSQVFDGGDDGRFITNTESTVAHTVLSHLEGVKEPFSTGRGARPGNDCGNRDISQCTELLEVLTRKEIGVLLSGLQCIDNYTLRCLNPQHRSYFNELYAGTIRVIKDLCNTRGQYQQEYIRHAPCMRQVHPKYNRCSETYHEKTAKLNKLYSLVKLKGEGMSSLYVEYLQCSEQIVYETCGNVTAQFTRQFLNRMAGPIVQTKCSRYEPGSYICLTAANLSPTLCPPSVVVTFILVGFSFSTNLLRIY
ncbi:Cytochrome P450 2L1 [Armadillidium nasatum]|uniref:Cytochrome P450 2L1 n=1 Tax=Armadillidium nasatum TaxID=96803 RepID=A0A5N5SSV1_9CRUS|nr:Cytochrome P450 2L1 [Armadillidium nasatum]